MQKISETRRKIDALVAKNGRYPVAAYEFTSDAVQEAVQRLNSPRHVTAAELLTVFRDFAGECFGPLSSFVLNEWGIERASDVGCIVYEMIGAQLLSASPEDSRSDFDIEFEFASPAPDASGTQTVHSASWKVPKIDR